MAAAESVMAHIPITLPPMTHLKTVQGIRIPSFFPDDAVLSALAYKPRPGDIFITSYPKSGTTWVQNIVYGILHDGKPLNDVDQLLTESPFLELFGAEAATSDPQPPTIKTHLPFDEERFSPHAKYIYVVRNPYDVCVSGYHQAIVQTINAGDPADLETYLRHFMEGTASFGRYFEDSLLPWYERRNDSNVLFLTYEDLHANIKVQVTRIAYFLGEEHGHRISNDPAFLQRVIDMTTKESMRSIFRGVVRASVEFAVSYRTRRGMVVPDELQNALSFFRSKPLRYEFIREGAVKSYKNILSDKQKKMLKEWISVKTAGSDVMKIWNTTGLP